MVTSAFGGSQNKASLPAGRRAGERAQGRSPTGRGCRQDLLPVLAGFSASPAGRNRAAGRATRPRPWVGAARAEPGVPPCARSPRCPCRVTGTPGRSRGLAPVRPGEVGTRWGCHGEQSLVALPRFGARCQPCCVPLPTTQTLLGETLVLGLPGGFNSN